MVQSTLLSTYNMLPVLMAYDNHDYGRWLPYYLAMLSSQSDENMTFFNIHFTQSIAGLLYSCWPPLDRNNNESELKAKARMDSASTD